MNPPEDKQRLSRLETIHLEFKPQTEIEPEVIDFNRITENDVEKKPESDTPQKNLEKVP